MPKLNLEFIRKRREKLGFTQADMAPMLGMKSKADYSRYENGVYTFDSNHVPLIAAALQVGLDDLYTQKVTKIETKEAVK
jgi:transcriptional regulator with XRE-family HTH domain